MAGPEFYSTYCPLPSAETYIRLLELYPAPEFSDALHCTLRAYPVTQIPPYEALSYTWGSDEKTSKMRFQAYHTVMITPSLEVCLRHLRYQSESRYLWVDQICINQDDKVEKSHQLRLMGDIYSNALRVVAWLGEAMHHSDQLLDRFEVSGKDLIDWGIRDFAAGGMIHKFVALCQGQDATNPRGPSLDAIIRTAWTRFHGSMEDCIVFFERPWFKRIWIVQEFALGPQIMMQCGTKTIPAELVAWTTTLLINSSKEIFGRVSFDELLEKVSPTFFKLQEECSHFMSLVSCRRRIQPSGSSGGLGQKMTLYENLKTLNLNSTALASDARDKIFGILALCRDADNLGIIPDYDASVETVYTRVARAITESGSVEFLNLCRYPSGERASTGLPSWVPDWRKKLRRSFCEITNTDLKPAHFAAGGPRGTRPIIDTSHEDVLRIRGCVVGKIEVIGRPWLGSNEYQAMESYLADVRNLCSQAMARHKHLDLPLPVEKFREAEWRVPCGDIVAFSLLGGSDVRATAEIEDVYMATIANIGFQSRKAKFEASWWFRIQTLLVSDGERAIMKRDEELVESKIDLIGNYQRRMEEMRDMRPFMTTMGHVGMAPLSAEAGNLVVIIVGSVTPFVLRAVEEDQYKLLGEAYCYLAMDGEMTSKEAMTYFNLI